MTQQNFMQRVGNSHCIRCDFQTDETQTFQEQDAAMMVHLTSEHPNWMSDGGASILKDRLPKPTFDWETCGIVELAVRNPNVMSYMVEWEGRLLKAEKELADLKKYKPAPPINFTPPNSDFLTIARLFLEQYPTLAEEDRKMYRGLIQMISNPAVIVNTDEMARRDQVAGAVGHLGVKEVNADGINRRTSKQQKDYEEWIAEYKPPSGIQMGDL